MLVEAQLDEEGVGTQQGQTFLGAHGVALCRMSACSHGAAKGLMVPNLLDGVRCLLVVLPLEVGLFRAVANSSPAYDYYSH